MAEDTKQNVEKTYTDPQTGKFTQGNPGGGRPKGKESFSTLYKKAIANIAKAKNISPEDFEVQLVQQAIAKGFNGDHRLYIDTMDRVHGKALQSVDHTSDGKAITFTIAEAISTKHGIADTETERDS